MWRVVVGVGGFPICRSLGCCGKRHLCIYDPSSFCVRVCVCVKALILITWATFHFRCFLFILILFAFVPSSLIACRDKGVSWLEMRIRARSQGRVDPPIECIDCTKWAQCSRSNKTIAFWAAASADVNDRLNGMYKEIVYKAFMCQLFCTIGLQKKKKDSAVYMYISCIWNLLFCVSLPVFGGGELRNRKQG